MAATDPDVHLQQGHAPAPSFYGKLGVRFQRTGIVGPLAWQDLHPAAARRWAQRQVDASALAQRLPLDQRQVLFVDFSLLEGPAQGGPGIARAGGQEHATGEGVQAVAQPPLAGVLAGRGALRIARHQGGSHGATLARPQRVAGQPHRFVDGHHCGILVQHLERQLWLRHRRDDQVVGWHMSQFDPVASCQQQALARQPAPDAHLP